MGQGVEPLQRLSPLLPQRDGVVVDVHEDEAPAGLLVDAAAELHGVLERLVHVGMGVGDGAPESVRERSPCGLPQVTPHDVEPQW